MATKKATTKQIATVTTGHKEDAKAALHKIREAMCSLESALTEHRSALAAQKALHHGEQGNAIGDALGWTMTGVYDTAEVLSLYISDMWDSIHSATGAIGIDCKPEDFFRQHR